MVKKIIKGGMVIAKFMADYKFLNISFSQEGEDMILRRIFKSKLSGFYIDIGAHHPKRFSNTFLLYKKGWTGINVDAMPGSMAAFKRYRPNDINLEVAISKKKEKLTYYIFNDPALNSFSDINSEMYKKKGYRIVKTVDIQTMTLAEVLNQNVKSGQVIDVMSVDVEGLDFEVLSSNDWELYKPKVIIVEIINSESIKLENEEVYAFLKKKNYLLLSKLIFSHIFVEADYYKTLQFNFEK